MEFCKVPCGQRRLCGKEISAEDPAEGLNR
uniref:Uncharacterized protein n=1 Tax=Ascaris lumbricoides TaxID=6252 RepID=A0A0M3HHJ7_ASCLU